MLMQNNHILLTIYRNPRILQYDFYRCVNCVELNKDDNTEIIGLSSHHCIDCNEDLCIKCVDAHKRIKYTRKHRLQSVYANLVLLIVQVYDS